MTAEQDADAAENMHDPADTITRDTTARPPAENRGWRRPGDPADTITRDTTARPPDENRGWRRLGVKRLLLIGTVEIALAAVIISVTIVVSLHHGSSSEQKISLEPAGSVAAHPFMPSAGQDATVDEFVRPGPPAGFTGPVEADTRQLFGDYRGSAHCQPAKIAGFLKSHPDVGVTWSGVLGTRPADLDHYLSALTPVLLRTDTAVTDHNYRKGQSSAFSAILQAGTAVLVDAHGIPVVKCSSGDPLTPSTAGTMNTTDTKSRYAGRPWNSFDAQKVVGIKPSRFGVSSFVLVDVRSGQMFSRPSGSSGDEDRDFVPASQTDWLNATLVTPACVAGTGLPPRVALTGGSGKVTSSVSVKVVDSVTGPFVASSPSPQAAVLVHCVKSDAGPDAGSDLTVVQVYQDGLNLVDSLKPPDVDGESPSGFLDDGLSTRDGRLTTVVDYPPPNERSGVLNRRTLVWTWNGTHFTYQVTAIQQIQQVPRIFYGTWTSDAVTQSNLSAPESLTVHIMGGEVGTIVGDARYPCATQPLLLRAVGDGQIYVEEEPVAGKTCVAAQIVRVTIDSAGKLHYEYDPGYDPAIASDNVTGGGVLTRKGD